MSLTYVIINAADVSGVNFTEVCETSEETLRWNIDPANTKTFVKFDSSDPTPSFLEGKTQYTHSEILEILATPEWSLPFDPG